MISATLFPCLDFASTFSFTLRAFKYASCVFCVALAFLFGFRFRWIFSFFCSNVLFIALASPSFPFLPLRCPSSCSVLTSASDFYVLLYLYPQLFFPHPQYIFELEIVIILAISSVISDNHCNFLEAQIWILPLFTIRFPTFPAFFNNRFLLLFLFNSSNIFFLFLLIGYSFYFSAFRYSSLFSFFSSFASYSYSDLSSVSVFFLASASAFLLYDITSAAACSISLLVFSSKFQIVFYIRFF